VAPTRQEPSDLQPISFAAALVAAVALVTSPMGAPAFAAPAAGELASGVGQAQDTNMGDSKSTAADAQPSVDPGWGRPSPMPHPPVSPPQTPSPEGPPKPSLPPGPPDLLPHKLPAPGPQPTPKPKLPQLPDVPPQLLPPCPPNLAPPQLLPPCPQPQVPPPIRPTQQIGFDGQVVGRGSSSTAAWVGAGPVYDGGALTSSMGVAAAHVTDTALVPDTHSPDAAAAIDAAFDAALNPAGDVPAVPSTLERPQDVKAGSELDSDTMSVNLDGRLPAAGPASKTASSAAPGANAASGSSSPAHSFAGRGGASGSDWQPGSLTVGQVLSVTGQLALQLLEVLVRGAAFVIKYTLKTFIWLVKLVGQAAGV